MHKFILLWNQAIAVDCATGLTRLLPARSFGHPLQDRCAKVISWNDSESSWCSRYSGTFQLCFVFHTGPNGTIWHRSREMLAPNHLGFQMVKMKELLRTLGVHPVLDFKGNSQMKSPQSEQDLGLQFLFSLSGFSLSWGNRVALRRENRQLDLLQLNEKYLENSPGFLTILIRTEVIQISEKTVQRTHDLKMLRMFQLQSVTNTPPFHSFWLHQYAAGHAPLHSSAFGTNISSWLSCGLL